ncbi:MAG: TatD family hydrolase [Oceanicoccus sp.]|uniref:TatD family hydrolase n=1 Tax=Oceanicoccus sp. TaxID=2691044 RepID=UPI00262C7C34|nr:TatD family hydrolase [Oceanicoccus sp.]MCP3906786.1 TatD family hydrolase [Oceanicoccus sp.]MDG1773255.1 TatD family hydrolase [Oceanicoccus sp.]
MFVDSHCHLDRLDLTPYDGDLTAAIDAAKSRGVDRMLCIGIDMGNAKAVVDIASRYEGINASVGVHPMDVNDSLVNIDELRTLALSPEVVAIGETGLDYYYTKESAELQRESFALHLKLSSELGKPVIVHTRDARDDTISIIRQHGDSAVAGVLHCFTESWEMASQALDENYYISFSGIVTFKNAAALREVAKKVPLDRILIETDSPYLAPMPYRGKKNEPKYVVEVAECIAELRGLAVEEVAEITSTNFDKLFFSR